MEDFGEILKNAREAKQIDIETVEAETTIARQYIIALEEENLSVFPGEAYLVGFLRNYALFLELDAERIVSLYKAKKLQEMPTPEALLRKSRPRYLLPVICAIAVLLLLAGCFCVYWFVLRKPSSVDTGKTVISDKGPAQYTLSDIPLEKRLYAGDEIVVPMGEAEPVILTVENTLSLLSLKAPSGVLFVDLGEELELDIDGKSGNEIVVFVSDISRTDASLGAEVRMFLKNPDSVPLKVDESAIPTESAEKEQYVVILQDTRAYPFTVNFSYRAGCVFRYQTDRDEPIEDYYTHGDILTAQAKNRIRLWVSNIGAVKLQILADGRTYDLEIGKAGRVVAEDIKWIRDVDGMYKLVVAELD